VSERYLFRQPAGRPQDRGASPPGYRRETGPGGMIIERDVPVPVRGGVTVYADVFRPPGEQPAPALVAWSPYGKHAGPQLPERYPDGGVAPGQLSPYTAFESPDPVHWTARGYAVVNADIPGTWFSGGDATFLGPADRGQRLAAGPLPGPGPGQHRDLEDRRRLARARHVVPAAVPGRGRGGADPGQARGGRDGFL
jgi:X-Pro dipeptidyl-peptidase (S15 family)